MNKPNTKNIRKGGDYEKLVANYFREQGYITILNGTFGDIGDYKIDVIAIKQNLHPNGINLNETDNSINITLDKNQQSEILLIQCKNRRGRNNNASQFLITDKDIKEILYQHREFEKYILYVPKNNIIKSYLIVSEVCIEHSVYKKYSNHNEIIIKHLEVSKNGEYLLEKVYGNKG